MCARVCEPKLAQDNFAREKKRFFFSPDKKNTFFKIECVCSAGKVSPPSPGGGGETFFLHVFFNGIVSPPSPW